MLVKSIKIKNFKGIENFEIDGLEKVNQFVGRNAVGKTSLNEAITFCFLGTKKDTDKIRSGADETIVEMMIHNPDDQEIQIRRTLKKNKDIKSEISVDGQWQSSSQNTIIKKLFGVSSFDPEKVLTPERRHKVFADLVEKKFEYPMIISEEFGEIAQEFLQSPDKYKEENPLDALRSIFNSLENYRLQVGRDKRSSENVYKEAEEDYKKINMEILETGVNTGTLKPLDKLLEEKAGYDAEKTKADDYQSKLKATQRGLEALDQQIKAINEHIARSKSDLATREEQKRNHEKDIAELQAKVFDAKGVPEQLLKEIEAGKLTQKQVTFKEKLDKRLSDFKAKDDEYKKINNFLQKEFDKLYNDYLSIIEKKIPELKYKDGDWSYRAIKIDDLSKSEFMGLALKVIHAQARKSNIVLLDNVEMFDEQTIKELDIQTKGTTFMLMKVGKPFDIESKVVELEKKDEHTLKI